MPGASLSGGTARPAEDRFTRIEQLRKERIAWWDETYKYPKNFKYQEQGGPAAANDAAAPMETDAAAGEELMDDEAPATEEAPAPRPMSPLEDHPDPADAEGATENAESDLQGEVESKNGEGERGRQPG